MARTFTFDAKLFASISVTANTEAEARRKLAAMLNVADLHVTDPDDEDETLTFETTLESADLDDDVNDLTRSEAFSKYVGDAEV